MLRPCLAQRLEGVQSCICGQLLAAPTAAAFMHCMDAHKSFGVKELRQRTVCRSGCNLRVSSMQLSCCFWQASIVAVCIAVTSACCADLPLQVLLLT